MQVENFSFIVVTKGNYMVVVITGMADELAHLVYIGKPIGWQWVTVGGNAMGDQGVGFHYKNVVVEELIKMEIKDFGLKNFLKLLLLY